MAVRHARGRHQHLASVRAYHGAVVHLLTHTAMDTSQHDSAQLQAQADAGDRGAQYKLATLHRKGAPGIPRDLDKAATLYALAAEQGHVEATFQVGMAYQEGAGVVKDLGQAAKWFARAAGKGHARAQYQMGQACAQGRGVEQNETAAVYWHRMAARQKHHWSQMQLGIAYYRGRGVEKDVAGAKACWEQAPTGATRRPPVQWCSWLRPRQRGSRSTRPGCSAWSGSGNGRMPVTWMLSV